MYVTFTRTAKRRYRVSVDGPGIESAYKDPAPGYDERLPHDTAHFIVENELAISGGLFGQLAAGGTANTFRSDNTKKQKKRQKRGTSMLKANRDDALFSEHAVYAAQSRWNNDDIIPETKIAASDIKRICEKFEEFARRWSELPVGGSIVLTWNHPTRPKIKR